MLALWAASPLLRVCQRLAGPISACPAAVWAPCDDEHISAAGWAPRHATIAAPVDHQQPSTGRTRQGHALIQQQRCLTTSRPCHSLGPSKSDPASDKAQWAALLRNSEAEKINPCHSKLHPAVLAGAMPAPDGEELSVQSAYTPQSTCFGCGPAAPEGLHLQSKRIKNGLEAHISIPAKYCAFPGILNGGIVSSLLDCHGNWTAAIALMDKGALPKPPLTLTHSMYVTYKEPTPPDVPLVVRSKVLAIKESSQPGMGKASVEVETCVYLREGGAATSAAQAAAAAAPSGEQAAGQSGLRLLVTGVAVHKRLGALRAL